MEYQVDVPKYQAGDSFSRIIAEFHAGSAIPYRIARFLVSGGIVATVNLVSLYILTEVVFRWYMAGAVGAFIVSVFVSFTLQKFWTFRHHGTQIRIVSRQFAIYLAITFFNLLLNLAILFLMVEFFGIWYILAQVIASIVIACESFVLYGKVFQRNAEVSVSVQ